jgi:uncharacterized protein (TIGR03437 family)
MHVVRAKKVHLKIRATAIVAFASIAATAQPVINPHGIVNGGSFISPGLPGGSIARGSLFTIFGQSLGPTTPVGVTSLPFSTTLGGVSIKVTQGAVALDAIPYAVGANQVNAIMPSSTPLGLVSVRLTVNGTQSNPSPVNIVNSSVGIIGAQGPGVIQNFNSQTDQPVNSPFKPAQPGQIEILWATGLGPVTFPDNITPKSGNLTTPLEVWVGGQPVTDIRYNGRSSYPGVDEIIFTVPTSAPVGCWVPVQIRTEGSILSNAVTMAITADGSPCKEPSNPLGQKLLTGGRIGVVGLTRIAAQSGLSGSVDQIIDLATLSLRQETGAFPFNPLFSFPPAGTCTMYTAPGDLFGDDSLPGTAPSAGYLSAGATFSISGATSIANIPAFDAPLATQMVGIKLQAGAQDSLIFNPGIRVGMSSQGSTDLSGFSVATIMPPVLTWTNKNQIQTIDRTQPLDITWSGAPSGSTVMILGMNSDQSSNSTAAFLCVAQPDSTSFTVPSYIFYGVRATRGWPYKSQGELFVGALPLAKPVTFPETGLDLGVAFPVVISSKQVIFK